MNELENFHIQRVMNEYNIAMELADIVYAHVGTCPSDIYDWDHPAGCDKQCEMVGGDTAQCWYDYAKEKVK
jgi:hypothetical protein